MLNRLARCRVKSFFHAPRAAEPMAGYPGEQLQIKLNHEDMKDTKNFTKRAQPGFILRTFFVSSSLNFLPRLELANTGSWNVV
jgi:hypothetical protein